MVVFVLLVLCNMVVSCSAIDCASRYTTGSGVGLFRFPVDPARRRLWISAIRRRKADGSAWVPSKWDRVCRRHFQSGRPHIRRRRHILILHRTSTWDIRHHRAWACKRHRFKKRSGRVLLSDRRSFLLAFGDLKEQGIDAAGPPLCLLSRRAKANGKEWRWQRCARTLSSIIRTLAVRASRLSRRLITVTRTILVAIKLNQVNSYPLQSRGMTLPSSAEVEVGTELLLRPAGGDPGLDHLQKYFFDSLCFLEWTWPFWNPWKTFHEKNVWFQQRKTRRKVVPSLTPFGAARAAVQLTG